MRATGRVRRRRPWLPRRRQRSERGAAAVLFAVLSLVLLGVAALGVDIAQQVSSKHLLIGQLDAASTAAASKLGTSSGPAGAVQAATTLFSDNGEGSLEPSDIEFWCVVARKLNGDGTPLSPAMVADLQIPTATRTGGVCNPDPVSASTTWRVSDYQNRRRAYDGKTFSMTCNASRCAIPCALQAGPANGWATGTSSVNNQPIACNTVRIAKARDVPFDFAPAIGVDKGSTGSQVSVACTGSCGAVAPNPMDVAVVADRTLSMTDPVLCTTSYKTENCRHDYRQDLVAGITGMLQVMTPEQQFVTLGALGPSELTRTTSESKTCTTSGKGLVYPSDQVTTGSKGSWVPLPFKNDYLNPPDSNGRRALNTNSKLVQAVSCLDDVDTTREDRLITTRTALAAPFKSAVRYLLGKAGDTNNIAALGGANRTGQVRKVVIFETDGEPFENATSTASSALSLENATEIFSRYTDHTVSSATSSTPVVTPAPSAAATAAKASTAVPAPPSPWNNANSTEKYPTSYRSSNGTSYAISYNHRTSTTTTTRTYTQTGGQKACQNFAAMASQAKAQGVLVITIGYNLSSTLCSDSNDSGQDVGEVSRVANGNPWISDVQPTVCRGSGNGTAASPYTINTGSTCRRAVTVTHSVPQANTVGQEVDGPGDARVVDVLAGASGGGEIAAGATTGCGSAAEVAAENSDTDLFFCAARGDDLAPLFVTALSRVSKGTKLMRMP